MPADNVVTGMPKPVLVVAVEPANPEAELLLLAVPLYTMPKPERNTVFGVI